VFVCCLDLKLNLCVCSCCCIQDSDVVLSAFSREVLKDL